MVKHVALKNTARQQFGWMHGTCGWIGRKLLHHDVGLFLLAAKRVTVKYLSSRATRLLAKALPIKQNMGVAAT
eukprot:2262792-Amphidinium_carterae.2